MSTLTHAQYNSPMSLYSRDNVQEVVNQVTGYPNPGRPHSAMSGTFDPNQSHVYRYLQTSGQLPAAHSARYDDAGNDAIPRYRGFVDPNVQSPSFKRLQYVTGVDSGAEDEISQEIHPPPRAHTEDIRSSSATRSAQQQQQGQSQPIALGYAPIGGGQQQQYTQQQNYDQQQNYQQQQYNQSSTQSQWADNAGGPPVAQRDPTADDTERDHPLDPIFAARIAEAERPRVPEPVVPGWTRYAERKHDRWQRQSGQDQPQSRTVQYYRPPASTQQYQPQYTLDSTRAAQDKWQAHYAPYRFEAGNTAASAERPRSRSAEPSATYGYVPGRRYGGNKEWMKPFIAPNIRFNFGDCFAPPAQLSYSPLSSGKTYNTSTKTQDYSQLYGLGQTGGGTSPYYGNQTYSSLSTSNQQNLQQQQQQQQNQFGATDSSYQPGGGGTRSTSTHDYTSTTTHGGQSQGLGGTTTGNLGTGQQTGQFAPFSTKDSQYSRTMYESRTTGGTGGTGGSSYQPQQRQVAVAPRTVSQPPPLRTEQAALLIENEAKRQRQMMEQELMKRAASAGPASGRQTGSTTTTSVRQGAAPQENRVTTYTTNSGGQQRWQQAPGSETKTQSAGSYLDPQGNKVDFTKEVYTSSDPGKEFSMLTEQEKKILEEPLQPGVVSRHITTKYYKKSTFTSSTTTNTSQTAPVTTTVTRQAIQSGPGGRQY